MCEETLVQTEHKARNTFILLVGVTFLVFGYKIKSLQERIVSLENRLNTITTQTN